MPNQKTEILNAILEMVQTKYADSIDLVVGYGSYFSGKTNDRSDIDFFFVPNKDAGYAAMVTFIIDGIGYDFWPRTWEQLEAIALHQIPLESLLSEGYVLFSASPLHKRRFADLKASVYTVTQPDQLCEHSLSEAKRRWFDQPLRIGPILNALFLAIAYHHGRFLKKGFLSFEADMAGIAVPSVLRKTACDIVLTSDSSRLPDLIRQVEAYVFPKSDPLGHEDLTGFYEELKSTYNKLTYQKDPVARRLIAESIEIETEAFFRQEASSFLPLDETKMDTVFRHEQKLTESLAQKNVVIREFANVPELTAFLMNR